MILSKITALKDGAKTAATKPSLPCAAARILSGGLHDSCYSGYN